MYICFEGALSCTFVYCTRAEVVLSKGGEGSQNFKEFIQIQYLEIIEVQGTKSGDEKKKREKDWR